MKPAHTLVTYLMVFFVVAANVPNINCEEYHSEYPSYEAKQYEYHHHEHHVPPPPPPPAKKAAHVDINIPLDFGTLAKLGILGFTQLKLLMALGKVGMAGLGVGALGLGHLGKIALNVAPVAKGGIAIDVGAPHHAHHAKAARSGYEQPRYEQPHREPHHQKHY